MQPWFSRRTDFDQRAGISLRAGGEMIIQLEVLRGTSRGNAISQAPTRFAQSSRAQPELQATLPNFGDEKWA